MVGEEKTFYRWSKIQRFISKIRAHQEVDESWFRWCLFARCLLTSWVLAGVCHGQTLIYPLPCGGILVVVYLKMAFFWCSVSRSGYGRGQIAVFPMALPCFPRLSKASGHDEWCVASPRKLTQGFAPSRMLRPSQPLRTSLWRWFSMCCLENKLLKGGWTGVFWFFWIFSNVFEYYQGLPHSTGQRAVMAICLRVFRLSFPLHFVVFSLTQHWERTPFCRFNDIPACACVWPHVQTYRLGCASTTIHAWPLRSRHLASFTRSLCQKLTFDLFYLLFPTQGEIPPKKNLQAPQICRCSPSIAALCCCFACVETFASLVVSFVFCYGMDALCTKTLFVAAS